MSRDVRQNCSKKGELHVTLMWYDRIRELAFTSGFREEAASVRHLGGLRFEVEGHEVEFEKTKKALLYAVLKFGDDEEAIQFYRRLKAAGVYAEVVGREVRLDDESYWGLLVTSGATPEGYQQLYPLPRDKYRDLYVFKLVNENGVYYYFAVRHNGVWRAVGGKYNENSRSIMLRHAEREVLEALKEAVKNAVGIEMGKIGAAKGGFFYRVAVTRPVLAAFEKRAFEAAAGAEQPEVYLRGGSIVVRHNGVEHEVKFAMVRAKEGVLADSSLYPVLKALGVRAVLMPQGVKLERDGMWGLLAAAVESALKKGEKPALPQGVILLKARPGHYVFGVEVGEERYLYSVLKFRGEWTAMGGKTAGRVMLTHAEEDVAKAHAKALNVMTANCDMCAKKKPVYLRARKLWAVFLGIHETSFFSQ